MFKGYKTFALGISLIVIPVLSSIAQPELLEQFFSNPDIVKGASAIVGGIVIVLRTATSTGIFQSK